MQSPGWYVRRLGSMSIAEVAWRLGCKLRSALDRMLIPWRSRAIPIHRLVDARMAGPVTRPDVIGTHLRSDSFGFTAEEAERWRPALIAHADRVVNHRLTLFDLEDVPLGNETDWNYEYKAGRHTPMRLAPSIDYRDYNEVGDCKFVWEPNRHCHLVVLGRAYRVTGDQRYAEAIVEQLDSWMRQCPYGRGMNWRSSLELSIRLINWVFAVELVDSSPAITPDFRERLLAAVYQHLGDITRQYSRFSSANNHLIGEAAGVFIASSYFAGVRHAAKRRARSRAILLREIIQQTYPDGGTREQAFGYHLFVLEFFTLAGIVARHAGDELTPTYWTRLEEMFDFVAAMSEGGDAMPMIGDSDDGYVLDLGGHDDVVHTLLCIGAVLFHRPDFKGRAGLFGEAALWLFGGEGRACFEAMKPPSEPPRVRSRAFSDAGYYLLQRGHGDASNRISVLLDSGELGYLSIAAHGHADALSLHLRVGGVDVLVDPGTYDYFTYPAWRRYFRSTRAHNTAMVDGRDQSEMLGPFMWGRQACCRCLHWRPTEHGGEVSAEHDGYAHLSDPVIHRRTVSLPDGVDELIVRDELIANGRHTVTVHWHFSERCRLAPLGDNRFRADFGAGEVTLAMDAALSVSSVSGCEDPILGWVSRRYHVRSAGTTLTGRWVGRGPVSLVTRITIVGPGTVATGASGGTGRR